MILRLWTKATQDCDPWEKANKWGEPYNYPSSLPEAVSRLQCKEGGIQTELGCLADWEDRFRVQEANMLEFAGQSPRDGELNIYPEICRSVSRSLWLSTDLHTHERKSQGKSHWWQSNAWSSHRAGISLCSQKAEWKDLIMHEVLGTVPRNVLP